jgi:short subunit dehydrogenase-like uncharacterized protein
MPNFMIYGANGYTGELIVREAVARGLKPIIAGRTARKIAPLSGKFGLEARAFSLDDPEGIDSALKGISAVLHCAGPFSITSAPMVAACLRNGIHYLDITGEIEVFEAMAKRDEAAKDAGVMIMPGVGFDVVPSDCLALHLKERLPAATKLQLAFCGLGGLSHGTQTTMTMNIGNGGAVRRDGKIVNVPTAWKTREIDFGKFKKVGVTIPWGDVATAYHTTGIPDIEVYTAVPPAQINLLRLARYLGGILATGPMQKILQSRIPEGGPTDEERRAGATYLWGRAEDDHGNVVESRQTGPEGYTLTVLSALAIVQKVLNGDFRPGFQTPARAYGSGLILEIEGAERVDL